MDKQRGSAILLALFVMTIVAVAAIAMASRLQIDIKRTQLMLNNAQAYQLAQAGNYWAMAVLHQAAIKSTNNGPLLGEGLIKKTYHSQMGAAKVAAQLSDLQGRFNINDLKNKKYQAGFINFLTTINKNLSKQQAQVIMTNIVNWISDPKQQQASKKPTEDNNQATVNMMVNGIPHKPMKSISELRLVPGVSAKLYNTISPYLIALPKTNKINVNSATAPVLLILSSDLSLSDADDIVADRQSIDGYQTISDFSSDSTVQGHHIESSLLTLQSHYFLVRSEVLLGQQHLTLFSILKLGSGQNATKNSKTPEAKEQLKKGQVVVLSESRFSY